MKSEFNPAGNEYKNPPSFTQSSQSYFTAAPEIAPPADEYPPLPQEFVSETTKATESQKSSSRAKKRARQVEHNFMVRLMSYAVACFVSIVVLSSTLHSEAIRDNVIAAGGSVDGDFRFSIQWNDIEENQNDFDAHCAEPNGYEIFFENQNQLSPCGGVLDVDIIYPETAVAVENIVYKDKKTMDDGTYVLSVVCYSNNGYDGGFRAQIELNGRTYDLEYAEGMTTGERVEVAVLTVENGRFTLTTSIDKKTFW